jgi:hypothetical protein
VTGGKVEWLDNDSGKETEFVTTCKPRYDRQEQTKLFHSSVAVSTNAPTSSVQGSLVTSLGLRFSLRVDSSSFSVKFHFPLFLASESKCMTP